MPSSREFVGAMTKDVENAEEFTQDEIQTSTKQKECHPKINLLNRETWLGLCGDCSSITSFLDAQTSSSSQGWKRILLLFFHFLDCNGRNFGQVCFANNPISGYLILIGLAIGAPVVALSGFVASTIGILFALMMRQASGNLSAGLCCYNAALLGSVLPALLFGPDPAKNNVAAVWLSVCVGAVVTVVMTNSLANCLGSLKPAMPIFTLPFNLVGLFSIVCVNLHQQSVISNANSTSTKVQVPTPVELDWGQLFMGSLLGAGQVFAVQDLWCSILVLVGMMLCSPLLAAAGFVGSLVGTLFGAAVSSHLYAIAYDGILGYNAFLAACSICFFYVPTWRSGIVLLVNATLTASIQVALGWAFSDVALPVLTLPFVGSSLLILGATASAEAEDSLPRPSSLTFPEQHRAAWRRLRRGSVGSGSSRDSKD